MAYSIYITSEKGEPLEGLAVFTREGGGTTQVLVPAEGRDITDQVQGYDNIAVRSGGYYEYITPVSALHPVTEFILVKKPGFTPILIGAAGAVAVVILSNMGAKK